MQKRKVTKIIDLIHFLSSHFPSLPLIPFPLISLPLISLFFQSWSLLPFRIAALNQWLTQVLAQSITDDMTEVSNNCKSKAAELRNERVRMIRNKIRETTGQDVNDWDAKVASFDLRGSQ